MLTMQTCPVAQADGEPENFLENEFFDSWEDGDPMGWWLERGEKDSYTRSEDVTIVGDGSIYIEKHEEELILSQEVYLEEDVNYHQEVWAKGDGNFSVGIQYPEATWTGYGDWVNAEEDGWNKATYQQDPTESGDDGQIRIRVKNVSQGLWIGASWLGEKEPHKNWPTEQDHEKEYIIEITTDGKGSTSPSEGKHPYEEGVTLEIEAEPDEGWTFDGWSGDVDSDDKTVEISMEENKSVVAHFEEMEDVGEEVERININKADVEELTEIVNIGEAIAQRIVGDHDDFYALAQLTEVQGLGPKTVTEIMEEGKAHVVPPEDEWDLTDILCPGTDDEDDVGMVYEEVGFMNRSFRIIPGDVERFKEAAEETREKDKRTFELFEYDEEVRAGEELESLFLLRNRDNEGKNLTVKSYVYENKSPVNEEGWHGNERTVYLEGGENTSIELGNRIKKGTEQGNYSYRIMVHEEDRKTNFTRKVKVLGAEETETIENDTKTTEERRDYEEKDTPTGRTFERPTALEELVGRIVSFLGL